MSVSSICGAESQASKLVTSTCTGTSLWLGGQSWSGLGFANTIGFPVSVTVTSVLSEALVSSPVFGSVKVTVRVASVLPTGNVPIGVRIVGSSKLTPGAVHR